MIYRAWSMFSATLIITGGIMGAVVAADVLFVNDPYLRPKPSKPDAVPSTK